MGWVLEHTENGTSYIMSYSTPLHLIGPRHTAAPVVTPYSICPGYCIWPAHDEHTRYQDRQPRNFISPPWRCL